MSGQSNHARAADLEADVWTTGKGEEKEEKIQETSGICNQVCQRGY